MSVPKDPQLQPASYLLFGLLYENNRTTTQFLERKNWEDNKSYIEATCRVLELLQLAKPTRRGTFGWKATNLLVELILKPRKRLGRSAKDGIEAWEENAVDMIMDAALGNRHEVEYDTLWYIGSFDGTVDQKLGRPCRVRLWPRRQRFDDGGAQGTRPAPARESPAQA